MRVLWLILMTAAALSAQVTYERIVHADQEPENWLTYSGNYAGHRYTSLDQIDRESVRRLKPLWTHQIEKLHKFETSPIVADGIMFISEPPSDVAALDARTGRVLWTYRHQMPGKVPVCCGEVNRGVAVLGETVYIGTLDARLVALDAKSGFVRWNVEVTDYKIGQSLTGAPLVLDGKVIVGMGGGEFGVRGFLDAYDAATGERVWRFWTVPGPGEPGNETWAGDSWKRGSATTWVTGSFDPELNLIYWGTGNPGPDWDGDVRLGDNLYSESLIALDADTGELKWHFQFTPHDVHDWDATTVPVLMDGKVNGRDRKLVLFANRNAFYYVLDRETGEFLVGRPFAKQTWAKALDEKGRPILMENTAPTTQGNTIYPGVFGATNWYSPSYSPTDHLFYVAVTEGGDVFLKGEAVYEAGSPYAAGGFHGIPGEEAFAEIRAFQPETGQLKWAFPLQRRIFAGLLSTAGGLVFGSSAEGEFFALNSSNGTPLWNFKTGGQMTANPVSYSIDGSQHVAIAAGHAIFVFALSE